MRVYSLGKEGVILSNDPNLARQYPADYLEGAEITALARRIRPQYLSKCGVSFLARGGGADADDGQLSRGSRGGEVALKSGNCLSPPEGGTDSGLLLEQAGKIIGVIKPHASGHLAELHVLSFHELLGLIDSQVQEILLGRDAGGLLENPSEMRIADAQFVGQSLHIDGLLVHMGQPLLGTPDKRLFPVALLPLKLKSALDERAHLEHQP